jgi:hypothetical protein
MPKKIPTPSAVIAHLNKLPGIDGCSVLVTRTTGGPKLPKRLSKLTGVEVESYRVLIVRETKKGRR